ncbi:MAG: hypothetical protein CSB44_07515 [Gammaproteobacteria bacterium]|nr:MAG: hypothetical protein CSB44_07515 [Gammaproteobacteria bacterium]
MVIAAMGGDVDLVLRHLEAGGDPDLTLPGIPTALGFAAMQADLEMTEVLLRHGADANHVDEAGHTPVVYSVSASSVYCMAALLRFGADIHCQDRHGMRPCDYCRDDSPAAVEMRHLIAPPPVPAQDSSFGKGIRVHLRRKLQWFFEQPAFVG